MRPVYTGHHWFVKVIHRNRSSKARELCKAEKRSMPRSTDVPTSGRCLRLHPNVAGIFEPRNGGAVRFVLLVMQPRTSRKVSVRTRGTTYFEPLDRHSRKVRSRRQETPKHWLLLEQEASPKITAQMQRILKDPHLRPDTGSQREYQHRRLDASRSPGVSAGSRQRSVQWPDC